MASHLPYLVQHLSGPLALDPRVGRALAHVLAGKLLGGARVSGADLHAALGVPVPEERAAVQVEARREAHEARIAVIPIVGVISQRAASLGASTEQIGAMLDAAMASDRVDAILFDVDSPGGGVAGVPELAARIREAAQVKPSLALSNSLAASAGYWLAAAAGEMWVTPSGDAGSIGVYTMHEDWSAALEKQGVTVSAISAGTYKTEGAPWEPLSDEARAHLQERVDEVYGWFTRDVAAFRGDSRANVRSGYGEGRVLGATQAKAANLVDRVGTFSEAVARLGQRARRSARRARADLLRRRLALDTA